MVAGLADAARDAFVPLRAEPTLATRRVLAAVQVVREFRLPPPAVFNLDAPQRVVHRITAVHAALARKAALVEARGRVLPTLRLERRRVIAAHRADGERRIIGADTARVAPRRTHCRCRARKGTLHALVVDLVLAPLARLAEGLVEDALLPRVLDGARGTHALGAALAGEVREARAVPRAGDAVVTGAPTAPASRDAARVRYSWD